MTNKNIKKVNIIKNKRISNNRYFFFGYIFYEMNMIKH